MLTELSHKRWMPSTGKPLPPLFRVQENAPRSAAPSGRRPPLAITPPGAVRTSTAKNMPAPAPAGAAQPQQNNNNNSGVGSAGFDCQRYQVMLICQLVNHQKHSSVARHLCYCSIRNYERDEIHRKQKSVFRTWNFS